MAIFASAATAQAQTRPEKVGDGIPTGQMSVQMFNYGTFISTGGNNTVPTVTGIKPAADGTQCNTSIATSNPNATPPIVADPPALLLECRWNRVEALFAFLQRKGVTSLELFGHQAFPAVTDVAGLQRYRALMDKYGLHAAGQHGNLEASVNTNWRNRVAAAKILGMDAIGSGGYGTPGIGTYENTLQTAANLNTIGKYSVEQGVGPVYVHNHTAEFDNKYMHKGELKSAVEIIVEETDPRYVFLEIDVFWSSDAFDEETGLSTAALINKYPTRIKQLHIKDGTGVTNRASATNSRAGSPQATGTGVIDFRPIFAAAKNRVQYYHQEHDGGTMAHADTSFTNLKGINSASVPALLGYPAGPAEAAPANSTNSFKVKVENTGDKPLAITTASITGDNAADFTIAANGCLNQTLANGVLATDTAPAVPRGTCEVTLNYKATANLKNSVAYLQLNSNADDATEKVLLTGQTTSSYVADSPVGGAVPATLALNVGGPVQFGAFTPGIARNYDISVPATVLSTAGDATLSVGDADTVNTGKLVNGAFALAQPVHASANNAANPTIAYKPVGSSTALLTYSAPTPGTDNVTLNFRQPIGANDPLRTGSYAKTLTFTVSTTTP
jgi:sugar phosphate isomerase/epimerase